LWVVNLRDDALAVAHRAEADLAAPTKIGAAWQSTDRVGVSGSQNSEAAIVGRRIN